jgi:hypothetical protein
MEDVVWELIVGGIEEVPWTESRGHMELIALDRKTILLDQEEGKQWNKFVETRW